MMRGPRWVRWEGRRMMPVGCERVDEIDGAHGAGGLDGALCAAGETAPSEGLQGEPEACAQARDGGIRHRVAIQLERRLRELVRMKIEHHVFAAANT